jgi:hypothetical protein
MTRRTRGWLRLVRLVIACVAFFVARPAEATRSFDPIVLVAELTAGRAAARSIDRGADSTTVAPAPSEAFVRRIDRTDLAPSTGLDGGSATSREPLVLVPEKYLRNCSLLC